MSWLGISYVYLKNSREIQANVSNVYDMSTLVFHVCGLVLFYGMGPMLMVALKKRYVILCYCDSLTIQLGDRSYSQLPQT